MNTTDLIAAALCIGLVALLLTPWLQAECLQEDRAIELYEQVVMAAIAILSLYVGARVGAAKKNPGEPGSDD